MTNEELKEELEKLKLDIVKIVLRKEELRGALGAAANDMQNAHNLLTPGMKAGVGEAKTILRTGAENAREVAK